MPRPQVYSSNAERQKAYRQRRGKKPPLTKEERMACKSFIQLLEWKENNPERVKQGKRESQARRLARIRQSKPFIAIDGEGYTRNGIHYYTMLASSEGDVIEDWKNGLSTEACFEFLHQYHNRGILVGFYLSYDFNMMLKDIPLDNLRELWNTSYTRWNDWHIQWMAGKIFKLTRDSKMITIYDSFGFFQKSFIKALQDWKIEVPQEIIDGKAMRGKFDPKQAKIIREYNLKECELLAELMRKLRAVALECGYEMRSYHGAGALANTVFKKERIEEYNVDCDEMKDIFLAAYYGGRNQVLQQGLIGEAYAHDINSAYPYAMAQLPSSEGEWRYVGAELPTNKFSVCKVRWKVKADSPLTPFPLRHKQQIYFPYRGSGWYWQPEVSAACEAFGAAIEVTEAWEFIPASEVKPFDFLKELYNKRRQYVRDGNDAQLILKLAINAGYGKSAQSIGFRGARPPYQNYFWAGWITATTRAMVLSLAARHPDAVVGFATDGVQATVKLTEHNLTKMLGGWSVDPLSNLFVIQPGVYCYDGSEHKTVHKSRGFSYKSVDYNELKRIWCEDGILGEYKYQETRFIGLGIALQSNPPLKNWRRWIEQERSINFTPNGDTSIINDRVIRVWPYQWIADESENYKLKSEWLPEGDSELT